MEKGEKLSIEITDVTSAGDGLGRSIEGAAIFVHGALPGDTVTCELTKVKKNYAIAKLVSVDIASEHRTGAACPYMGRCGGCVFGGYDYEKQLEIKKKHVEDAFSRIGKIENVNVEKVIGMERPLRCRNKATFTFYEKRKGSEEIGFGFYEAGSHRIAGVEDCRLQTEAAVAAAGATARFMTETSVTAYDKRSRRGTVMNLVVRTSSLNGSVMAILVVNGKDNKWQRLDLAVLAEAMDEAVYEAGMRAAEAEAGSGPSGLVQARESEGQLEPKYSLESFYLNINKGEGPGIFGKKFEFVAGTHTIVDAIGLARFELSPESFYQVNGEGAEKLYDAVWGYAGLQDGQTVFDLYCGVGSIGLYLSKRAHDKIRLIGIESNKSACLNANRNAVINRVVNALYYQGKAEEVLPDLLEKEPELRADVAVLDPPRAGCDQALLESVTSVGPDRIIYVSCDQPTAARDMLYLSDKGYELVETTVVDMFPFTGRVESVTLLRKSSE
ncbi:MAG: 23S rRNA (uracil(1939)-C(5))-methyltransferase RlmD [Eubacteriales bacterium]|nr:23S rRNA (uracil(1939)-C(5))-methyltransferase RlmD [Eubacteriales bacterium]